MELRIQLQNALKDAMRAGDVTRKSTIRMAIAAIKLADAEKGVQVDDNVILTILQKEVKSRRESIADAERADRPEMIQSALAEIAVLEGFLPKALSAEELEALAREAISESGATSMREMGQVMKLLVPRLQGRATGEQASQMVRKLLG
jgi:uncharacterized protein YqeY